MADNRSASFRRLGTAFATGGDRYERLRPGYPDAAVDWLVAGIPARSRAVDVGAGTGKLTSALVGHGFEVTAIDPSADMLDQLTRRLPGVRTRVGTGENTGLSDRTADLITFAQSWHWVEPEAGCVELARVLEPGGRVGWVWNFLDVREPWVAELAAIWHTLTGAEATQASRHRPILTSAFDPVESVTIDWTQTMRPADLADLITTRSYYLSASAEEREQMEADVAAFLGRRFPEADEVDLPYRTHCFRSALRRPSST